MIDLCHPDEFRAIVALSVTFAVFVFFMASVASVETYHAYNEPHQAEVSGLAR